MRTMFVITLGSHLKRVAQMLENASNILRGTESTENSQMHQTSGFNTHALSSNTTQVSSSNVRRALDHARNMIRSSTASGTYRRLNRSERLRATAPFNNRNKTQAKPVASGKKKALEFALLKCFGDSSDEDLVEEHHLKWDSAIANGMIMLDEEDDEQSVRNAIKESVGKKFPIIRANDSEFVKVRQKKISVLELGPGTEYNYSVVKKMAGQGLLYVKVKEGFECVYGESSDDSDEILLVSPFSSVNNSNGTDKTELTVAPLEHTIVQTDGLFVKYIRQVASGRRPPVTLSSILIFVTGAAEEPVLGFTKQPTITFVNGHANDQVK